MFANFGYGNEQNGQAQKSRSVAGLLRLMFGLNCRFIDVGRNWWRILEVVRARGPNDIVFVSLGRNGIRVFAAITAGLRRVRGREHAKIYYLVVGGWIADLASRDQLIRSFLRTCDAVLVEAQGLAAELSIYGVNAIVFPNFRTCQLFLAKPSPLGALRLCFCSRIVKDKGPLKAVELVYRLRAAGRLVTIDFFGPVDDAFKTEFDKCLNDFVRYRGSYNDSARGIEIMRGYDFLVLPTAYPGECMPGAIIEAFFAGTPTVCSDWRFLPEVVDDGSTGVVVKLDNFANEAAERIVDVLNNQGAYERMSAACLTVAAERYSLQAAQRMLERLLAVGAY